MATLTYDPTEPQESEFTAEEQESLAVGEQLEQQQQQLLAGKYRDAEELEKAYIELQGKLGERQASTNEEEVEQVEPQEEEQQEVSTDFLDRLWSEAQDEFSEETLEQLREMDPADLAQMYLEYRANESPQERRTLTAEDQQGLKSIVGGDENYSQMMQWAGQNLTEQEINMYDAVMERGDPLSCYFAVQALGLRYNDMNGVEGEMLTGKPAVNKADTFRSQAEVVRAMSDPRYDNDPAYRQDVFDKLERSDNLQF